MKLKLIISVLASLLITTACQNKEKEEAISAIKQWMRKEILFPKNSVFTIRGSVWQYGRFADKIIRYRRNTLRSNLKMRHPPAMKTLFILHADANIQFGYLDLVGII